MASASVGSTLPAVSEVFRAVAEHDPMLRRPPALAMVLQGLPVALGLASHAAINLVDMAMVGRLGADAVLAAHVGSTWNFLPMIVGNSVSTALLSRLSRHLGNADHASARALNRAAQWFMVCLGLLLSLLTALPAGFMVDRTGLVDAVRDDAVHYLVVSNLGCLPMFVLMQTTAAMRAVGEAIVPLVLLLSANLLNLLLAAVLLYGFEPLGIESVGVAGAAYAAVAARTLAAIAAAAWLLRRQHPLSLRGSPGPRVTPGGVAWPLLADACPQVLQIGLRAGLVIVLTGIVVQRFGSDAAATLGITTRCDTLVLFAALGFASAATAYAGRAIVVGAPRRARAAGLWAALQAGVLGAAFVGALMASAGVWLPWFLPDPPPAVAELTRLYLGSAAWGQVFGAVALGAIGAVQGSGRMLSPLVVDAFGFAIAFAWLFAAADGTLAGLYGALVGGMAVVAVLQLGLVALGRWARPV